MRARKGATATRPAEPIAIERAATSGTRQPRAARASRNQEVTQLVLHLPKTASAARATGGEASDKPRSTRRAAKSAPESAAPTPVTKPRRARAAAPTANGEAPRAEPPVSMSARREFVELRALIANGWEIVPPIYARPLWSSADDRTTAFNFVLKGADGTRLITVPEGRTVERFIRERQLKVNHER
jgi:hypothetical protein